MSGNQTGRGLHSQLEEFLSEVDSITPVADGDLSETVLGCEWIVRLDPITNESTYHHIRSGAISMTMPEEYKRYLSTFDAYLCDSDVNTDLLLTNANGASSASSARRQRKKTSEGESSPLANEPNGLSGIIGYGDSETDSEQESKMSPVAPAEIDTSHRVTPPPDQSVNPCSPTPSTLPALAVEQQSFIGPVLPSNHVSSTRRSPSPTWACQYQQRKPTRFNMEQSARTLLDQFTALDMIPNTLDTLRMRYVQLATRFEDWHCGKLSSNYFWKKLIEAESELKDYAASNLPHHWICHWDSSSKRFYYENRSDSTSQWERPCERFKERKKKDKKRSGVKLVDYDILDQQSWLESPTKTKSQDCQPAVDVVMSPHSSSDKSMCSPLRTTENTKTEVFQDSPLAKKAHLISQLAEFELACQQMEKELDFSRTTCTIVYDPVSSPRVISLVPAISDDSDSMGQQEC